MQLPALWLVMLVVLVMMTGGAQMTRSEEVFTNAFLVELKDRHGNDVANEVAKRNGFTNMGPVSTNIASQCMCFYHMFRTDQTKESQRG